MARDDSPADGIVDPRSVAGEAGLFHVTDEKPGITRRGAGKGFAYRGPDGKPLKDMRTPDRIRRPNRRARCAEAVWGSVTPDTGPMRCTLQPEGER